MTIVDPIVALCIATLSLRGYRLGFWRETLTFLGWFLGLLVSLWLVFELAPPLSRVLGMAPVTVAAGFFVTSFILIAGSFWLAARRFAPGADESRPTTTPSERRGGLAVGCLEGVLLMSLLLYAIRASPMVPAARPLVESSLSGPPLSTIGESLLLARHRFRDSLREDGDGNDEKT